MTLADDLLTCEKRLCAADANFYREISRSDAVFLMPGMAVGLDEAVAGLEQSPPWDHFELTDVQVRELGNNAAAISYRFDGIRGNQKYAAYMTTAYERSGGAWTLVLHQQTPA